ncbi:MAG: hypothetical protein ACOY41_04675 [Pseudomonadota bacterium]
MTENLGGKMRCGAQQDAVHYSDGPVTGQGWPPPEPVQKAPEISGVFRVAPKPARTKARLGNGVSGTGDVLAIKHSIA